MTTYLNDLRREIVSAKKNFARIIRSLSGTTPRPLSYDMLFKDPKDGCALYDDVWGG